MEGRGKREEGGVWGEEAIAGFDPQSQFSETVLWIQSPEALQILGFAIQNRQSKIQNRCNP
jgi:hypothetical protein